MKTLTGLSAGIFWALDTVILGIALSGSEFIETQQAIFLAPFVSAFLHDFCSCLWMFFYTAGKFLADRLGKKGQYRSVTGALKTRSGKYIILGALCGGPIGMTGYVFAIRYLGASYTAMISALFPALGAVLSRLFLKERLSKIQLIGFICSIFATVVLGYSAQGAKPENFALGFFCALLCVAGWAAEVVICAYGMRSSGVDNEQALMIRQTTSALFHGIVILNLVRGWDFARFVMSAEAGKVIALAALSGTVSYLCYYKAIRGIGPSKAMALNITYAAWAILLEFLILQVVPDSRRVVCGIVILVGSLISNCSDRSVHLHRSE